MNLSKSSEREHSSERLIFIWPVLTALFDFLTIAGSICLAYGIRFSQFFYQTFPPPEGIVPPFRHYYLSALIAAFGLVFFMIFRGVYGLKWNESITREIRELLGNFYLGFAFYFALIYFYRGFLFSRLVAVISLLMITLLLILVRIIFFQVRIRLFHTNSPNRVLLIGRDIRLLGERLSAVPQAGFLLVHSLEISPGQPIPPDLTEQVEKNDINMVILALPFHEFEVARSLISSLEGMHLNFLLAPDPKGLITTHLRSFQVAGIPMLKLREEPFVGWNGIVKRIFDVSVAVLLGLISLPIALLVSLAIKLTSRGPLLYRQERIGLDGKSFTIYKFRSMRVNAEKQTGPVWASKGDSRTTPVGRFIRRWSIDELPQLWNIIRGDMSIVGPRPERPHFVEQFKDKVPRYSERHRVLCGLTGWAQVNGLRGESPIEIRTQYDLFYIENWSLGFDIKILFMTIIAVLFGKDAY